ncbi:MAG: tape measure protein [Collinsella sp.]|nr:tape measure protein [Collinsella sp.]
MADVASGSVLLTPKFDNLTSSIADQLDGAFSGASNIGGKAGSDAGGKFSSGLSAKAGAVMGLVSSVTSKAFDAISNSLGSAIGRVDTMNNFPKVMKNLGYSSDDATASIKKMSASIDGLPTSLPALTGMVQQLAPLCGGLDEATNIGIAFNDMCLASGASTADVSRAMQQYSQILSKGIPDMQDWKTLQEVMPGQLNQVAKSLLGASANSKDLYSALKSGKVSMSDFNQAVMKLDKEGVDGFASFAQQAKDATQGIGTALDNIPNRISKALQKVIDAIGATNISGAINKLSSSFSVIGDMAAAGIERVKGVIENIVGSVKRFIGMIQRLDRAFGTFSTLGRNIDILGRGIRGAIDPAINAVRNAINSVKEFAGETFTATWPEDLALKVKGAADAVNDFIEKSGGITTVCENVRNALVKVAGAAAGLIAAKSAISGFTTALENAKTATAAIKGFAGAAKTGIGNVSAFASMISGDMAGAFSSASGPVSGLFSAIKTGGGAIATLIGPVGIAVGVIAALAAGFAYMMTTSDGFRSSVMQAASALASGFQPVIESVGQVIQTLAPTFADVFGTMAELVTGQLLPSLGGIALAVMQVIATVAPLVGQIIAAVLPVVAQIIQVLMRVAQVITSVLIVALNIIRSVVQAVWPVILAAFTVACSAISALISTVWPVIEAIITTVMQVINAVIGTVLAAINGDWNGVWTGIQSIIETVWTGIQNIVSTAIGAVSSIISSVLNTISGVWSGTWGAIKWAFSSIWNGIRAAATSGIDSVYTTVTGIKDKIVGFFSGAGSWLVESGKSILNGLKDGIEGAIGTVTSSVSGAVEKIRGLFPFSPAKWGPFSGHGYTTYSGKALMGDFGKSIVGAASSTAAMAKKAMGTVNDALVAQPVDFSASSRGVSGIRSAAARVAMDVSASRDESAAAVIGWLGDNLPAIISECTPVMGESDFGRKVRKAVAYA